MVRWLNRFSDRRRLQHRLNLPYLKILFRLSSSYSYFELQLDTSDSILCGSKSSVRCKLIDGYDEALGDANAANRFISPERKGPDRKKCRVKHDSPARMARLKSALKQSETMLVPCEVDFKFKTCDLYFLALLFQFRKSRKTTIRFRTITLRRYSILIRLCVTSIH